MRNPNCQCQVCGTKIYRRPCQIVNQNAVYCSKACYQTTQARTFKRCVECDNEFRAVHATQRFCSKTCATTSVRKASPWSTVGKVGAAKNSTIRKLMVLQTTFNFTKCMVEGCEYNTTFDVHRYVPGKQGGKYEIGNMFAVCPNHHAEVTRGIITLDKVDDCTLRIV